jgi:hypothetical protein
MKTQYKPRNDKINKTHHKTSKSRTYGIHVYITAETLEHPSIPTNKERTTPQITNNKQHPEKEHKQQEKEGRL